MSEQRVAINPEFAWTLKWWAFGGRFPLIPQWRYKKADRYNTAGFWCHWLGFRLWTMDSPDIGIELNLDDQQVYLRLRLPYLIFGWFQPLFPVSWSHKIWRKTPRHGVFE